MVEYEDECVSCGVKPCFGDSCPNHHVRRLYCDECGDEVEKLYVYDADELCSYCVLEKLECIY